MNLSNTSHVLKPNAQCDIRRWGFWEVIRSWSKALINGISVLIKEAWERAIAPSALWGYSEKTPGNGPSLDMDSDDALILNFPTSRNVGDKIK